MLNANENPVVMDDGRNRLSHDAGCVIAGAVFFGYFLCPHKESNVKAQHTRGDNSL